MLWVPKKGIWRKEHNVGAVGTVFMGPAVTTDATLAATKGAPVQLIASTAFDAYKIKVVANEYGQNATASAGCLDILIGAATEEVLIPDLLMGNCGSPLNGTTGHKEWVFPLYIPAGSRLSARVAGQRLAANCYVAVFLYGGDGMPPWRVGSKVTTYGVTVPNGTFINPGAGVEGAWTQVAATSNEDHFAFVPSFQFSTASLVIRGYALDIGIGAATEEEIGQSYMFGTTTTEICCGPIDSEPTFQDVPAGTRLVMRASNTSTNSGTAECAIHAMS